MQEYLQKALDLPVAFHVFEIDNSFIPVNKLLNVRPQMGCSWQG